jgi:hypothetical protein
MAYQVTDTVIGAQAIATTSTTQNHPLGTVVRAKDPTYGEGEFIYLTGIASTVAGDAGTYDASFVTARAVAGNALPRAVAFAMSANVADQYGWYQIGGIAIGNKTKTVSMAAGIAVGISTTALISASSSLKELQGALVAVVGSATTTTNSGDKITLMIDRPHLQGRIT